MTTGKPGRGVRVTRASARVWRSILPPAVWAMLILLIATLPTASLVPRGLTSAVRMPRDLLQFPYHVGVFLVLAGLSLRGLETLRLSGSRAVVVTLAGAIAVSIASELLQFVTPTRRPALGDLMLDVAGATIGVMVVHVRRHARAARRTPPFTPTAGATRAAGRAGAGS
jgi:hypothetical protein